MCGSIIKSLFVVEGIVLVLFTAPSAFCQSLQCTATSGVPPTLRAEGLTELAGDLVLSCTGGTEGQAVSLNLTLSLNTTITSRLIGPTQSEALLLVDELQGAFGALHQATRGTGENSLQWVGIPIVAPGAMTTRTLRITNVRVNAAALGASGTPAQVVASLSASGGVTVNNPEQVVGFVTPGVGKDVRNCLGGFTNTPTEGTMHYTVHFWERYNTAFKKRITVGQSTVPPGTVLHTESGFVREASVLPPEVGSANTGTRLMARFTNLPAGARLFVTTVKEGLSSNVSANLMPADANGAIPASGSITPIASTTSLQCDARTPVPAAEIPVVNGSATAVWEIVEADPSAIELVTFGFAVEAPGTNRFLPTVEATLAPLYPAGTGNTMSETLPIPRFGPGVTLQPSQIIWMTDVSRQATSWNFTGQRHQLQRSWGWVHSGGAPGWKIVAVGDFNRDGVNDLVWQEDAGRKVTVWFQGGTGGTTNIGWRWVHFAGAPGWTIVGSGDFNRDGTADLIWQKDDTRQVTVWYMGGAQGNELTSWNWLHNAAAPGWKVVGAGDFNRDGTPDLIWQKDDTRQVTVWYMGGAQGNELTSWNWIYNAGAPGWRIAAVTDVDQDGNPDLIWQNDTTRQATVWYMSGTAGNVMADWEWIQNASAPGWSITAGN